MRSLCAPRESGGGHAAAALLVRCRAQNGDTPLHIAAHWGRPDVVRLLVDAGADKSIADKWGGHKPIDVVCRGTGDESLKPAIVALLSR